MKKFLLICFSVMTFFAMSLTAFASEEAPVFEPQEGYHYYLFNKNGEYYAMTWDASYNFTVKADATIVGIVGAKSGTAYLYKYNSTSCKWSLDNTNPQKTFTNTANNFQVNYTYFVKTTVDIYDFSGNVVFQPLTLEGVTVESLEGMKQNLDKTALTVTLCGVGCLALLIGCHLLRKKSVLFLSK